MAAISIRGGVWRTTTHPAGTNYLVCFSEADAIAAAAHQADTYDILCRPVRVK